MLVHNDSRKIPLKDYCAHLVYADPPRYGIDVDQNDFTDKTGGLLTYQTFTEEWVHEAIRIMHFNSFLVVFTSPDSRRFIENEISRYLSVSFSQELIWHYKFGTYTRARFVPSHDNILVYKKGDPKFHWDKILVESQRMQSNDSRADQRGRVPGTVLSIPRVPGNSRTRRYIGRKRTSHPEDLAETIIKGFSDDNSLIVDLFCGSGTVPKVCNRLGRTWISFDIKLEYIMQSHERVYNDWRVETRNL